MTSNAINTRNPLLQLVSSNVTGVVDCNVVIPYNDNIPQNDEGVEVDTLAITPRYSDSTLIITYLAAVTNDGTTGEISVALFQDATAGALVASSIRAIANQGYDMQISYTMASGTTSSTTFKIRIGPDANNCYLNGDNAGNRLMGGVANARLMIREYR